MSEHEKHEKHEQHADTLQRTAEFAAAAPSKLGRKEYDAELEARKLGRYTPESWPFKYAPEHF